MADINILPIRVNRSFKFKESARAKGSKRSQESEFDQSDYPESGFKGTKSSKSTRIFKWFLLVASLALAVELIWFLGVTPFRPFSRIDVSGYYDYDRDSLLAFAGLNPRSSYILTNAQEIETLLASLPQIESARVFKRFPRRLEIHLQARQATALSFASIDGITVPVLFDRHGVLFHIGTAFSPEIYMELPVISGIVMDAPVLGMRLPAGYFSFLEDLEYIRVNAPDLLSAVSEIRLDRNSTEGLDITLFLQHQRTKVLLSGLNEGLLRYTLLIVDVLADMEGAPDVIDFRAVIASYFPKGGSL